MTSVTMAACERNMDTAVRPRGSLEELVDRLMETLFSEKPKSAALVEMPSLARSVYEARRLRQRGRSMMLWRLSPALTWAGPRHGRLAGRSRSGGSW